MTEAVPRRDRRYSGTHVDITYNVTRCIHAEFCIRRLGTVFDNRQRPWINPNGAPVEQIAAVIEMCPSGALHYERHDGVEEVADQPNTVQVRTHGPLEVRGQLSIGVGEAQVLPETRATLCRCGASKHKPFCDNSHREIGFEAASTERSSAPIEPPASGPLTIIPRTNGPLLLRGPVLITNEANEVIGSGEQAALCRCGHSGRKPFCDGTHERIGFVTGE